MSSTESDTMTVSSRCAHDSACQCPTRTEHAELLFVVGELFPQWMLRSIDDEDHNKAIAAEMKRHHWRYKIKELRRGLNYMRINYKDWNARYPEIPPDVRPFRWLISYHILPNGYQYDQEGQQPPWRMLVRCFLIDLPSQLSLLNDRYSIKSWKKYELNKVEYHNQTKLDEFGQRAIFSPQRKNSNRTLCGDWLVIIYLWAADRSWNDHVQPLDLIPMNNLFNIQAREWADSPTKIPYLFYELKKREDGIILNDDGLPHEDHDTVPNQPSDRAPERLSVLRNLMNTHAKEILYY